MNFSILPVVFLLHCFEEWQWGFPDWATRHFGPITTSKFYLLSHLPLLAIVLAISIAATFAPEVSAIRFSWIVILTVIFTNGIFHLASTLILREYSPGLLTSMTVTMPYGYFSFSQLAGDLVLPFGIASIVIGAMISSLIVYSLTWRKIT